MNSWEEEFPTLGAVQGKAFQGKLHRLAALEAYEQPNDVRILLYDQGPLRSAGGFRFTPPGSDAFRGIYAATELVTAGSEYAGSREKWEQGDCPHHVGFTIEANLKSVLDLTDRKIIRHLALRPEELAMKWLGYFELHGVWPVTWSLGKAAFDCRRFEGIMFHSTKNAPGGKNLLIFTSQLDGVSSWIEVLSGDGSTRERVPSPS